MRALVFPCAVLAACGLPFRLGMRHTTLAATAALLAATTVRCTSGSTGPAPNQTTSPQTSQAPAPTSAQHPTLADQAESATPHSGQPMPPPGSNLPPEDAACVNHTGDGATCWGEWLKEMGTVDFKPVMKGQLGAGPWPTTAVVTMGGAEGLDGPIVGVSVDTGQNIYAVSEDALFIRRAGAAKFERYDRGTNGLRDFPFLSVAGAKAGQAFVGHEGNTPESEFNDPPTDPPEVRQSGDIERIDLTPNGIQVTGYNTHNSNSPSGSFDHMRSINNIVIPRRGPAAGEVYISSEHAVARYTGDKYADHRHVTVNFGGSDHFGAAKALAVTDDGTMWYGSDFEFGGLAWTPRLYEWYFDNDWLFPLNVYGDVAEQDWNEGIGVDSKGGVWVAARYHGLTHMAVTGHHGDVETIDMPDTNANDLVVDTNDTVWVGTDGGLFRFDPVTKLWTQLAEAGGGIVHVFLDDTVAPRAIYVGNHNGVTVYRGP